MRIKPVKVFEHDLRFASNDQLVQAINAGSGTAITAMNNSWGSSKIDSITHNGNQRWYKRPYLNYADNSSSEYIWAYQGATALTGLPGDEISAWQNATQNTIIVFANGNDGLNTQTGQVQLYSDATADTEAETITNAGSAINQNIPSFRGSYPVIDSSLSGEWLTVIALDQNNQIASFSNGCGIARDFCIAAPGVGINAPIDVDDTTNTSDASYGLKNGTSMAAPHVTGALALLKQQFPNLTPAQLTSLVLSTATDLGATGTDDIYGVGMLNLAEASRPQGSVSVAGINGQPLNGVNPSQTSIQLSSVFGQLFRGNAPTLGLIDGYQRAYIFEPALEPAPEYTLSAQEVMQLLKPAQPEPHPLIQSGQMTLQLVSSDASLQGERGDASQQGEIQLIADMPGMQLSMGRQKLSSPMLSRHQPADTGAGALIARSAVAQIAPVDQPVQFLHPRFRLSQQLQLELSHLQGSFQGGGDFSEFATHLNWMQAGYQLGASFGVLAEKQTLLGATLSGFYAPASDALSRYLSIQASQPLGRNISLSSRFLSMMTEVEMQQKNQLALTDLAANSYQLSVDRWADDAVWQQKLAFTLPLATMRGHLHQVTTKGYNGSGYHNVAERYDLANPSRQLELDFSHQQQAWQGGKWLLLLQAKRNVNGIKNTHDAGVFFGLNQHF